MPEEEEDGEADQAESGWEIVSFHAHGRGTQRDPPTPPTTPPTIGPTGVEDDCVGGTAFGSAVALFSAGDLVSLGSRVEEGDSEDSKDLEDLGDEVVKDKLVVELGGSAPKELKYMTYVVATLSQVGMV